MFPLLQHHRLLSAAGFSAWFIGIQFPSVAWWYLFPSTSGSVTSWEKKKEMHALHCPSVCRADARLLSFHLWLPGLNLTLILVPGPRSLQPDLTLGHWGNWAGICSWEDVGRASCPRCVDCVWMTSCLLACPAAARRSSCHQSGCELRFNF